MSHAKRYIPPMATTKKSKKHAPDTNEIAHRVMLEATGQKPKTPPPAKQKKSKKQART